MLVCGYQHVYVLQAEGEEIVEMGQAPLQQEQQQEQCASQRKPVPQAMHLRLALLLLAMQLSAVCTRSLAPVRHQQHSAVHLRQR